MKSRWCELINVFPEGKGNLLISSLTSNVSAIFIKRTNIDHVGSNMTLDWANGRNIRLPRG